MASAILLILCLLGMLLLSMVLFSPNVRAIQTSIMPLADSYVSSDHADMNYGGAEALYVYRYEQSIINATHSDNTWLKFNLSEIPSETTINSITLRMRTSANFSNILNRVGVFICDDNSWTESGITWNNAPALSSTQPLCTVDVVAYDRDYDFELNSTLRGKSAVTLVLKAVKSTNQFGWATFDSKESSSTQAPKLVVDYSVPSPSIDPKLMTTIIVITAAGVAAVAAIRLYLYKVRRKKESEKSRDSLRPRTFSKERS